MNLLSRFALLFLVLTLGLGGTFWLAHHRAESDFSLSTQQDTRERSQRLRTALSLHGRPLETLVSNYSWWNDMVKYIQKPDPAWAAKNIDNMVGVPNGGDSVWVINNDLQLVHTMSANYERRPLPFKSAAELKTVLQSRYTFTYYTLIDGKLWQIFGAAVQSAEFWRHETPVHGYVLVGKEWDDGWLAPLGALAGARLSVGTPDAALLPGAHRQILNGLGSRPIAVLDAVFNFNTVDDTHGSFDSQLLLIGVAAIAALATVALALGIFVLRPLGRITRSLESRSPTHLNPLITARGEFGEIARLVAGQLRWGRMLEEEMQRQLERANPDLLRRDAESNEALRLRLSGDIHDGPIQSIYAAGLQLSAMQAAAEQGKVSAPDQFALVNSVLQQASSDLRNLILDLEPEELREQDLESALHRMERHLKQFARCAFELDTGDNLIDGLSRSAQTELYFICRELTSNALRHARPANASLRFSARNEFLHLEWYNDGSTRQTRSAGGGNGLRNIERRVAELGGTVTHGTEGKSGWRVVCEIPFTGLEAPTLGQRR